MSYSADELAELKALCPHAAQGEEGGTTVFVLPSLPLPNGCAPAVVDALLWPTTRDDYPSRLFLSEIVTRPGLQRNWNANVSILNRNWHAFSWNLHCSDLRLAQMVAEHLRGLR